MLGYYCLFLSHLNRCIFTFISAVFAKWNEESLNKGDDTSNGILIVASSLNVLYPILIWLCTRFHYHFTTELLFLGVANLIEPIFYFYNNFGSGNLVLLSKNI